MTNFLKYLFVTILFVGFSSCEDEPQLPDNVIEFESSQLGFISTESELTININFSREATEAGTINLSFVANGVDYGTDFTTEPAASGTSLTLNVDQGVTQASFKIIKSSGVLLDGDESIEFTISSSIESLVIGEGNSLSLSFAEILATLGEIDIDGGGATYPNKVFIDLSANRQTAVNRTTWDLGFYTGSEFKVILNSSNGMIARQVDETDLNAITAIPAGFEDEMDFNALLTEALDWVDDPAGDLNKLAIDDISATDSENKIYIVKRGSGPGAPPTDLDWRKIRILRSGSGYKLQHAAIDATTFSEVTIDKDDEYLFNYVSFETGAVDVEPAKDRWDIAWTGFTNSTNFGTGNIPYYFQDMVLQNRFGVEVAGVMTTAIAYEDFSVDDLPAMVFTTSQISIGSSWRSGGGPGMAPSLKTDIYYIVKDTDGNIFKLRFTALTQGGERGRPALEYELVQAAG